MDPPLGINPGGSRMKKTILALPVEVSIIAYDDVWCRFCADGICDP